MWRSKRPCVFFWGVSHGWWYVVIGFFVRHTKLRGGGWKFGTQVLGGFQVGPKTNRLDEFQREHGFGTDPLSCGFLVGFWGEDFRGWQASFLFQVEGSGWDMFQNSGRNIFHWDFSWMSSFGWLFTKSLNGILLGPQNPPDCPPGFHRDPFQRLAAIAVGFSTSESWGLSRRSGCNEKKWTQKIPCLEFWDQNFLTDKTCWRSFFFPTKKARMNKDHTPVNWHGNGKWTVWRCIS